SVTPAGIRTFRVRVLGLTPSPPHSGHGSSMRRPVPRQSRHGSEKPKWPWLFVTRPWPPQVGQVRGLVPGFEPEPPQLVQRAGLVNRSPTVAPCTASANGRRISLSTSAPRRDCVDVRVPRPEPPPPKRPPNRSPSPPPPPAPPRAAPPSRSSRLMPPLALNPPGPLKPLPKPP